jgi:hypothetical protein
MDCSLIDIMMEREFNELCERKKDVRFLIDCELDSILGRRYTKTEERIEGLRILAENFSEGPDYDDLEAVRLTLLALDRSRPETPEALKLHTDALAYMIPDLKDLRGRHQGIRNANESIGAALAKAVRAIH